MAKSDGSYRWFLSRNYYYCPYENRIYLWVTVGWGHLSICLAEMALTPCENSILSFRTYPFRWGDFAVNPR
jgi:hypothetical protein